MSRPRPPARHGRSVRGAVTGVRGSWSSGLGTRAASPSRRTVAESPLPRRPPARAPRAAPPRPRRARPPGRPARRREPRAGRHEHLRQLPRLGRPGAAVHRRAMEGERPRPGRHWMRQVPWRRSDVRQGHGGHEPGARLRGRAGPAGDGRVCGTCHSDVDQMRAYQIPTDQYAKYKTSVHGQQLLHGQRHQVAICTDCHGVHDVKKASDPTSKVYPLNVPALCASCHANATYMEPYGIPTDQYDVYKSSVHGQAAARRVRTFGHRRAPRVTGLTTPSRPERPKSSTSAASAIRPPRPSTSRAATRRAGGGSEVLDVPRHARRRDARRGALLPPARPRSTAPPVTTWPTRRCSSTPIASRATRTAAATRATTRPRSSIPRPPGSFNALVGPRTGFR